MNCPKCQRPVNEGNSPNAEECHETDGDDGLCEAYAKIAMLTDKNTDLKYVLMGISRMRDQNPLTDWKDLYLFAQARADDALEGWEP